MGEMDVDDVGGQKRRFGGLFLTGNLVFEIAKNNNVCGELKNK
jgi:hypothetical protein